MNKTEWLKRVEEFVSEIARDDDLGDDDYLEVLDELEDRASVSAVAKREEMERG